MDYAYLAKRRSSAVVIVHWVIPTLLTWFAFQLVGSPQKMKEKGFKLAFTTGFGYERLNGELDDSEDVFTTELPNYLDSVAADFSIIAGYRFNLWVIGYINNYYTHYWLDGGISQNGQTLLSVDGNSYNLGSVVGLKFGTTWFLTLEAGVSKASYEGNSQNIEMVGLAGGYSW